MEESNNSGVNTILIVIILVVLVGLGVWWVVTTKSPAPESNPNTGGNINVDLTLPASDDNGGDVGEDTNGGVNGGGSGTL